MSKCWQILLLLALALMSAAGPVHADPVSLFLGKIAASITLSSVLTSVAISVGLSFISRVLFKPKVPDLNSEPLGRTQIVRSSVAPRRVIYGRVKTSGVLVFAATSGARNKYLHLVIVLTGHEVHAIDTVLAISARCAVSGYTENSSSMDGKPQARADYSCDPMQVV